MRPVHLPKLALAVLLLAGGCRMDGETLSPRPAPPFPARDARRWVGSPQDWTTLRGRVVLLDVWTFG